MLTLCRWADWERHPQGSSKRVQQPFQEDQQRWSCQGEEKSQAIPTASTAPGTSVAQRNSYAHKGCALPTRKPTLL